MGMRNLQLQSVRAVTLRLQRCHALLSGPPHRAQPHIWRPPGVGLPTPSKDGQFPKLSVYLKHHCRHLPGLCRPRARRHALHAHGVKGKRRMARRRAGGAMCGNACGWVDSLAPCFRPLQLTCAAVSPPAAAASSASVPDTVDEASSWEGRLMVGKSC